MTLTETITDKFSPGRYPDALVPIKRVNGSLKVNKAENQGFWIKVYADKNQPAGEYTGKATITYDKDKTETIDITCTVWDYTCLLYTSRCV